MDTRAYVTTFLIFSATNSAKPMYLAYSIFYFTICVTYIECGTGVLFKEALYSV
jgi:hypothetical protein